MASLASQLRASLKATGRGRGFTKALAGLRAARAAGGGRSAASAKGASGSKS